MNRIPGFQSFRSKEVWLCAFAALCRNPYTFGLPEGRVRTIGEEMLRIGEMGPGPRRLLRWCAGVTATKDALRKSEKSDFAEVHDCLFRHFSQRFDIKGIVQVYFAWCEVSKAVNDLYTCKGILYKWCE